MRIRKGSVRVLHVCSEIFPYLKTGGLADVTAALPAALSKRGCDVRMLVPGFPDFMDHMSNLHLVAEFAPRFGASALRLLYGHMPCSGLPVYLIDAPGLYDRPGNPYLDAYSQPYNDNHCRFALLGWMAARIAEGFDYFWRPQIVHGHDWHAGLAFAYLHASGRNKRERLARTVFTIHNMAYQGNFPGTVFRTLDLPGDFYNFDGIEFYGQVSFLKSGLVYADKLTTVSPTYAKEISRGELSYGLGGVLATRQSDLTGILNGIDTDVWNPSVDAALPATYNARSITGKKQCRLAIQQEMSLMPQNAAPLFCIVSRFAAQKGLHLVLSQIPAIVEKGGQVIIVGNGEHYLESGFSEMATRYPQHVAVNIGYEETLAHRVIAGSDVIMIPSLFEPCGLTQMYGLKYGTLPLVHQVGGLADTVTDSDESNLVNRTATGFSFEEFTEAALERAIGRAFALFPQKNRWRTVQRQGMRQRLDWKYAAAEYKKIYDELA